MSEVINFYLLATTLKNKIRTGWQYWNVPAERLESIAEHIYGACILAIGIDSEYNINLDLRYAVKMLAVHELEEVKIGDNTPFDAMTAEEKLVEGKKGVEWILGGLIKKQEYVELLDEFNEGKTKEAKFAYLCDKLEADMQAKVYDDEFNIDKEKASPKIMSSPEIQEILANGYTSVGDIWIEYDRHRYEGNDIFLDLLSELQETDTYQLRKSLLGR